MKKPINIYKTFDIVIVPFPFTDTLEAKKRPAIVLSAHAFNQKAEHSILAMITSTSHNQWPFDMEITDLSSCGLLKPSLIRFKLFTFDHRLILSKIGSLSKKDQKNIVKNFLNTFETMITHNFD